MIIVGTAQVNQSTGQVELIAPMGFNTAEGVRLSNFNQDTVTITGIDGRTQTQEYLAPQTQMVYATANIGIPPTVVGFSLPASDVATNLLVEWSTDPTVDFIGTYPAALPTSPSIAFATGIASHVSPGFPNFADNAGTLFDVHAFNSVIMNLGLVGSTFPYIVWYDSGRHATEVDQLCYSGIGVQTSSFGSYVSWISAEVRVRGYFFSIYTSPNSNYTGYIYLSGVNSVMPGPMNIRPIRSGYSSWPNIGSTTTGDRVYFDGVVTNVAQNVAIPIDGLVNGGPSYESGVLPGMFISGKYYMSFRIPSDATFRLFWSNSISTATPPTMASNSPTAIQLPVATDGDGVITGTTRYINKEIWLPPTFAVNPNTRAQNQGAGFCLTIDTASTSSDTTWLQLIPAANQS